MASHLAMMDAAPTAEELEPMSIDDEVRDRATASAAAASARPPRAHARQHGLTMNRAVNK